MTQHGGLGHGASVVGSVHRADLSRCSGSWQWETARSVLVQLDSCVRPVTGSPATSPVLVGGVLWLWEREYALPVLDTGKARARPDGGPRQCDRTAGSLSEWLDWAASFSMLVRNQLMPRLSATAWSYCCEYGNGDGVEHTLR
jgi:hypothetical protein